MDSATLRLVVAIVLFVHAIGHLQGVIAAMGFATSANWNVRSWLFDNLLGVSRSRNMALLGWAVCVIGFFATALAFIGVGVPHEYWRTLATVFAFASVLGLVFYWNSFAQSFNKAGALGVNAIILVGLLFYNWPTEELLGF